MKWMILPAICLTLLCSSGCASKLPPHEELNLAVKKSFSASGFNYRSQSRITDLNLSKLQELPVAANSKLPNFMGALDIVHGFKINIDGAVDLKGKRSEALYDLHYDKDNVEISIRLPLHLDYNTQTIYLGPSIINTLLNVALPQQPAAGNRLIRINIPELLREATANAPDLARLTDINKFSANNMDLVNGIFKKAVINAVANLDDAKFSELPLAEQDRQAGVQRKIRVNLTTDDAVTIMQEFVNNIGQALFREGAISEKEFGLLQMLTNKQILDELLQKIELKITQDVGVAGSGYISGLETKLLIRDRDNNFQFGVENTSRFERYDAPQFSITPETSQIIDIKEVIKAFESIKPKTSKTPATATPDKPAEMNDSVPEQTRNDTQASLLNTLGS